MGEIKQTNFRIDTEKADAFRAFCEQNGMNQAQGFDHIMQVLEMNEAKAAVPERLIEIEEFERHAKALVAGYLNSLELAKNTENRVLEQFESRLASKDKTIMELQEKLEGKDTDLAIKEELFKNAEAAKLQAEERATVAQERMIAAEKTAQDKAAIAEMLTGKLAEAEDKLKEYPALKASEADLKTKLAASEIKYTNAQKDAEIALERAVTAIQKKMDTVVAEKDLQMASKDLQAEKALSAMEKAKNKEIQGLRDKIDALKDEKAALKDELAELKSQVATLQAQLAQKSKQK